MPTIFHYFSNKLIILISDVNYPLAKDQGVSATIENMKYHKKTLHQIVDELVTTHLSTDAHTPSIRIALVEAIKVGERLGYAKGYNDAKAGCRQEVCGCEIAAMEES